MKVFLATVGVITVGTIGLVGGIAYADSDNSVGSGGVTIPASSLNLDVRHVVNDETLDNSVTTQVSATCPTGYFVIGGSAKATHAGVPFDFSGGGVRSQWIDGSSYTARFNVNSVNTPRVGTVTAVCMDIS